jgi:hypothetical protein
MIAEKRLFVKQKTSVALALKTLYMGVLRAEAQHIRVELSIVELKSSDAI